MSAVIASLMERKVVTVSMDDTIPDVERLFADTGLSWAPVLDSDRTVVGVISETDLLQLRARNRDVEAMKAWLPCTYKPVAGVVSSLDFVRAFVRS